LRAYASVPDEDRIVELFWFSWPHLSPVYFTQFRKVMCNAASKIDAFQTTSIIIISVLYNFTMCIYRKSVVGSWIVIATVKNIRFCSIFGNIEIHEIRLENRIVHVYSPYTYRILLYTTHIISVAANRNGKMFHNFQKIFSEISDLTIKILSYLINSVALCT